MKNIIAALYFFVPAIIYAQSNDIESYKLMDLGSISISKTMEVQSGNYKKIAEEYQRQQGQKFGYEVAGDRIVFQQKGLNNFEQNSFSTYARVIIETEKGSFGDYEKLTANYTATAEELTELGAQLRNQIEPVLAKTGIRIIIWNGVEIVKVNGRPAMKMSYIRQLHDNPYVIVSIYSFQNNDRMHKLTISYRQKEESIWKDAMQKTLNSFTITNVR